MACLLPVFVRDREPRLPRSMDTLDTPSRPLVRFPGPETDASVPAQRGDAGRSSPFAARDHPGARARTRTDESIQDAVARVLLPRRSDSPKTVRLRGYLMAAGNAVLAIGLILSCFALGALPADAVLQLAGGVLAAMFAFHVAFRTGINRRARDPNLTVPQMAVATLVVLYAMYAADASAAGVFLFLLLMIFLFGMLRLRTRGLLLYALFIMAGHAAVIALRWHFRPEMSELTAQLLQWVALAFTLPWFALMAAYISGLRDELGRSNAEQRESLQAIRASESSLAQAQRIARLGSWAYDRRRKEARWSEQACRILGVDPARPPSGDEFAQLVHPDDRQHYRDLIGPGRDGGRAFDGEFRIVLPDGETRWLHVVGEPVVDEHATPALLRGTVMDITARKSQEQALVQARDEAAAARADLIDAIEGLTEAFALFDADDRLVLCNSRYAATFTGHDSFSDIAGWRFEDLVRASVAKGEAIAPEFADDVEAWVADRIWHHRNPGSVPREIEVQGGRRLQVSERHTNAGGIVGVSIDITERKQFEQRQTMEHAVTRLLADADTVSEAMPKVIRTICETLGWDCGASWQLDKRGNVLRCGETWSVAAPEIREFLAVSSGQYFAPTLAGLIRRVWTTGRPVWIADVASDAGFQRAPAALKAGLHGAFAFPVAIGAQTAGVMEFYVRNIRQPDQALLGVLESIGLQIGQFIARKAAQGELQRLAHFDFLTGLPNRNLFNQLLEHAFAKAKRNATPLGLLFIDLDGFKQVNDSYGHDAGDHLLVTFTQRLRKCLRGSDTLAHNMGAGTAARLGGDEFVVLVDEITDASELAAVAKRILAVAAVPFDLAGPCGQVTASIGISVFPGDGMDVDDLVRAADNAMYEAKQAGKNAYRFFSPASLRHAAIQ